MWKLLPLLVLPLVFVRCSDEPKDLCSRLTDKCGAEAGNTCRDGTAREEAQYPNCTELVQAFSACIASLTLSCDGTTDVTGNGTPARRV